MYGAQRPRTRGVVDMVEPVRGEPRSTLAQGTEGAHAVAGSLAFGARGLDYREKSGSIKPLHTNHTQKKYLNRWLANLNKNAAFDGT